MRPKGNFTPVQTSSSSSSSSYAPQYSMANSSHPAINLVPNGRHYAQPSAAGPGHNPVATSNGFYGGNNNGINHSMQQYHQDNRRGTTLPLPPPPSSLPPPPPPPPTTNSSTPSVYNGFHYSFPTPANASAPISPHHVGLPLAAFSANHSIPS